MVKCWGIDGMMKDILKDQYAFHTEKALDILHFKEVKIV